MPVHVYAHDEMQLRNINIPLKVSKTTWTSITFNPFLPGVWLQECLKTDAVSHIQQSVSSVATLFAK